MKVLLVDDEPVLRRSLTRIIGRMGHEVIEAGDGEGALAAAEADVALVDVKLPGMNGVECVRRLRQKYPRVQAVLMTGERMHDQPDGIRVMDKPFGRDELRGLFEELKAGK